VYPSTIVGIPPQEDAWMGKAIERIFLAPIKMTLLPEIIDMHMPVEGVFHNLVIVKIKNEYEGHAQKVMNAMWGAGQMMFNKILVIVDGETNIHNYEEVAKVISENVNPADDIFFSQGPMDVLDHACSKFAFGGKMCIDATRKADVKGQKTEDNSQIQNIKNQFSEIISINDSLLKKGISVVFISVKKNRKNHIKELNEKLFALKEFSRVKFIIYLEEVSDAFDIKDAMWRFANNFDPKRDSHIIQPPLSLPLEQGGEIRRTDGVGLDGTRKTKQHDNFDRPWPNIICADEKTIKSVDTKWEKMFSALPFIKSPSLKYRSQLYKGDAVVEE
jgi:4-hydroxy-3-polyprenylbenzoate decarboxylase